MKYFTKVLEQPYVQLRKLQLLYFKYNTHKISYSDFKNNTNYVGWSQNDLKCYNKNDSYSPNSNVDTMLGKFIIITTLSYHKAGNIDVEFELTLQQSSHQLTVKLIAIHQN